MRRSDALLFAGSCLLACGGAPPAERSASTAREPPGAHARMRVTALPMLPALSRAAAPAEPVRILHPTSGASFAPEAAHELVVRVEGSLGASGASLELSLDGARPRPVRTGTLPVSELADGELVLGPGAHDLVLVAFAPGGGALDPARGGLAWVRFFVGPPPAEVRPRVVCLRPFGTYYGASPELVLDFAVLGSKAPSAVVSFEGSSTQARAVGPGPFALGAFESGDHSLTIALEGRTGALPGHCVFTLNHELERPP